jgi:hypothetical protein
MRVLLTTYGSCGDVEPTVGLVLLLGALAALAGEWDAPVANRVMPTGGWR